MLLIYFRILKSFTDFKINFSARSELKKNLENSLYNKALLTKIEENKLNPQEFFNDLNGALSKLEDISPTSQKNRPKSAINLKLNSPSNSPSPTSASKL